MYPNRTPPAHLRGDPGQPRLLDGTAVFAIGAAVSVALTIFLLREFAVHIINRQWAAVPLMHFPKIFITDLFATPNLVLFGVGAAILSAGLTGIGLAAWAGVAMGRAIGGQYGIRYIVGPVLQIAPPPKSDNKNGIEIAPGLRLDVRQECRHIEINGSTGSGKTTVIYPIIKQALARFDRAVIWDEKAGFVELLPHVTILSPWDKRAERWALSLDLKDKSAIQDFANHVCPSPATGDSIWAKAAAAIVIACAIQLSEMQGKWFLSDLRRQILAVSIDLNILQKTVQQYYPEAAGIVSDLKSKALSSVIFQLSASLQSILMLGEMDMELDKLDRKPFSLLAYLRTTQPDDPPLPMPPVLLPGHPTSPDLSSSFCGAIINYISKNLAGRADTPPDHDQVWLFLDEFPQIGKQDGVIRLLEVGRSKSVRVVIGIQGPEQIQRVYSHDHVLKTILNNTLTKFHFQYLDHDAAQWASDSLGKSHWKVRRASHSTGGNGGQNVSWQDVESEVYQPSEFMHRLGPRESARSVYCVIAGLFPDPILSRHPFLSDPKLRVARDMIEIPVPRPLPIAAALAQNDAATGGADDDASILPTARPDAESSILTKRDEPDRAITMPMPITQTIVTSVTSPRPQHAHEVESESGAGADEVEEKLADHALTAGLDILVPGAGTMLDLMGEASEITDPSLPVTPADILEPQAQLSLYERMQLAKKRKQEMENEGGME
ncbi:MAG: type IV secretion system DNA-binding domain-containing protein [Acidithiobacillus sp.]